MIRRTAAIFFATAAASAALLTGQAAALPTLSTTQLVADSSARNQVCQGIFLAGNPNIVGQDNSCGDKGIQLGSALTVLINLLSLIIGIAAVVMIIVGGFKFITSGGDASKVASAKGTLIYALVGLAVVVLAQMIVRFVLTNLPS